LILVLFVGLAGAGASYAQQKKVVEETEVDRILRAAFPKASADWLLRLKGDETMQSCSDRRDAPAAELARAIEVRETETIQYPVDGQLIGEWKRGENVAQRGYGLLFTDYPVTRENGGNCYACHQLTKQEVSYGTMGPSLLGYGRNRNYSELEAKAVYEKIY